MATKSARPRSSNDRVADLPDRLARDPRRVPADPGARPRGIQGNRRISQEPRAGLRSRHRLLDLNRMTGGLHRQNLVVVAARPGLGKTSFCLNVACHAAIEDGQKVGIFSLEMSKPEITKRMISSLSRKSKPTGSSRDTLPGMTGRRSARRLGTDLRGALLRRRLGEPDIAPAPSQGAEARSRARPRPSCRRLPAAGLRFPPAYENRTQEVTEISRGLKNLAKGWTSPSLPFPAEPRSREAGRQQEAAAERPAGKRLDRGRLRTSCSSFPRRIGRTTTRLRGLRRGGLDRETEGTA